MVGYNRVGLSGYWHGVYIEEVAQGNLLKKVPFMVTRPKLPSDAIILHVSGLTLNKNHIMLTCDHDFLSDVGVWTKQAHLAAGVYQNISLLINHIDVEKVSISDHELVNLGTIKKIELLERNYIKKKGLFILEEELK